MRVDGVPLVGCGVAQSLVLSSPSSPPCEGKESRGPTHTSAATSAGCPLHAARAGLSRALRRGGPFRACGGADV